MGRGGEEPKENVGIKPGYWDCILYRGQINQESDQRIFVVSLHKFCLKLQLYNILHWWKSWQCLLAYIRCFKTVIMINSYFIRHIGCWIDITSMVILQSTSYIYWKHVFYLQFFVLGHKLFSFWEKTWIKIFLHYTMPTDPIFKKQDYHSI